MGIERRKVQLAVAELIREKGVREKYYPNAIRERKLSQQEANRRLEALEAAIEILTELLKSGVVRLDTEKVTPVFPSEEAKLL